MPPYEHGHNEVDQATVDLFLFLDLSPQYITFRISFCHIKWHHSLEQFPCDLRGEESLGQFKRLLKGEQ